MSNSITVAELLVRWLNQLGVRYIFGVPGGTVEPFYNALADSWADGRVRPVTARHETGAAFMAEAYARETGNIGVVCSTSGPGATNLMTGVASAFRNNIPLLVITGQPSLSTFGQGALQESSCTGVDIVKMMAPITIYNTLVTHPGQAVAKLAAALLKLRQPLSGPAHLAFPSDVLRARIPCPPDLITEAIRPTSLFTLASLQALPLSQFDESSVYLIGRGAAAGLPALMDFIEHTQARFVVAPDAKGLVDTNHPGYCGVYGFAGHQSATELLASSTGLLVGIGLTYGEWSSAAWSSLLLNERLIQVDEHPQPYAYRSAASHRVVGPVSTLFEALKTYVPRAKSSRTSFERAIAEPRAAKCHPADLMRQLASICLPKAHFFADAGTSMTWATHWLDVPAGVEISHPWLHTEIEFASMGWAIGNVVGAAIANPEKPAICLTGDGSFLMSGQELSVAVSEYAPAIFVVLNDAAFGMVKHGQRLGGAAPIAHELPQTDFAQIARAQGASGYTARSISEVSLLPWETILSTNGPSVIDVQIDREAVPPMGLRVQVLNQD